MNEKILIIDDDKFIITALTQSLNNEFDLEVLFAYTYEDAKNILLNNQNSINIAIVDLHLPDADDGDAVKMTTALEIPTIILTGSIDDSLKEAQENQSVIEYILKNDKNSTPYLMKVVNRVLKNSNTTVLIVDDSNLQLTILDNYLKLLNINVVKAKDGVEALAAMDKNTNISMVITDYQMPNMDGLVLTEKIRSKYNKDRVSIIALSAIDNNTIASDFLKMGANDFLNKPLEFQEFYTRVNNNLEMLQLFGENQNQKERLSEMAFTDMLTKIHNRTKYSLYLKQFCKSYDKQPSVKDGMGLYLTYMHIDGLSYINKKYGYTKGDQIITHFAKLIENHKNEKDIFARIMSAEFAIISTKTTQKDIIQKATEILDVLTTHIVSDQIRFSIGIAQYEAKEGMNRFSSRAIRKMLDSSESPNNTISY